MKHPYYSFELKAANGIECDEDSGRWYCYDTFVAEGDTLDELMLNCSGFIVNQDGGEGREVHLDDVREPIQTHLRDELLDAWKASRPFSLFSADASAWLTEVTIKEVLK